MNNWSQPAQEEEEFTLLKPRLFMFVPKNWLQEFNYLYIFNVTFPLWYLFLL